MSISESLPALLMLKALIGIALVASSAAVVNHVVDARIDTQMRRTQRRPVASGRVKPIEGILFASILGIAGVIILFVYVNPLTAWLNIVSWIGYGLFYTIFLKHKTSQNIVIGGLFGAAPPLLGWAAVTNTIDLEAIVLVAIIFVWTPPHFWALAIDRTEDYAAAKVPMLPLTHGDRYTRWTILVYTVILFITTILPYVIGMSGVIYLVIAIVLGVVYLGFSIGMLVLKDPKLPVRSFKFSTVYLGILFAGLLMDRYFALSTV